MLVPSGVHQSSVCLQGWCYSGACRGAEPTGEAGTVCRDLRHGGEGGSGWAGSEDAGLSKGSTESGEGAEGNSGLKSGRHERPGGKMPAQPKLRCADRFGGTARWGLCWLAPSPSPVLDSRSDRATGDSLAIWGLGTALWGIHMLSFVLSNESNTSKSERFV